MIAFVLAATALLALTLAVLLWPRGTDTASTDALSLNRKLYREQLSDPSLDDESRAELERRALEDLSQAPRTGAVAKPLGRGASLALAGALALGAAGLYVVWGSPEAMEPVPAAADHAGGSVAGMVDRLAAKLAQGGGEPQQWAMLARSYHALGRNAEAAQAFEHVGPALQQDAQLLADYADTLASLAAGKLSGRPMELVDQALRLDPELPMALSLAAVAAWERGDRDTARRHWEHLLRNLPADSDEARWVQGRLAEAGSATAATMPAAAPASASDTPMAADPSLSGTVSISPALAAQLKPDATLFLLARAAEGSRMPLAIQRHRASELPLTFRLTVADAMSPQASLASAGSVVVEARVSQTGEARPASGDLYGLSSPLHPGAQGLAIVIDQRH